ncbi:LysE family translocator [Sphaerimonospora thailandensis]|uniref:Lysine transporter LysE n=1 Tax=Sphaerimonospora thailandensis TaxID=795644 RepID=A0A8J3R4I1_9ACTN|nr:LysE family translocator [Sphaerimonospora thailandensis]GIH68962.1 lysine transporter LysE [Sphaerimonospora thailandensis]
MVEQGAILGVVSISLGMVLSPGPNMLYLVSRSIGQGRRAGIISLCGVVAGFLVYLVGTNLGLAALITAFPGILTVIRLLGAGYLLWLAWKTVRPGGVSVFTVRDVPDDPPHRLFAMGLMTNLLNPKIAILYISVIPQFIDLGKGNVLLQGIVLGGFQIMVAASVNLSIVLAAGGIAGFLSRRPGWLRAQRAVMGGMLGMLAVLLAFDTGGSVSHMAGRAGAEPGQAGFVGGVVLDSPPRR